MSRRKRSKKSKQPAHLKQAERRLALAAGLEKELRRIESIPNARIELHGNPLDPQIRVMTPGQ